MFPSFLPLVVGISCFFSSLCYSKSVLRLKSLAFPVKTCVVVMLPQSQFPPELYCTVPGEFFANGWMGISFPVSCSCKGTALSLTHSLTWTRSVRQCRCRWREGGSNESSAVGPGLHLAPSKRPPLDASCQHNYPCPKSACMKTNHGNGIHTVTHMYSSVLLLNTAGS
jgi:hypothetical protein